MRPSKEEAALLMTDPDNPRICIEVWEPIGLFGRARGLLGYAGIGLGRGFLIRAKWVHTVGMLFPIDVVHISRKGRVIRVQTMHPGRIGPCVLTARWVLELDGGEAERLGIRVGGRLVKQR
ncbi:MAG TPA: DUF192 domain-containing protein [Actinomycetota bacterium]|nr:DUF192 domain-containing protein [Actinomycetota bacterium]